MKRNNVYEIINQEREYQDIKWGGPKHDAKHSPHAFLLFMQYYMEKARTRLTIENSWDGGLEEMRKVVALGVACFEQYGVPSRHEEII